MDIPEYLYLYASHYHYNHVKCVLAIENWKDLDCDVKYARYIQEFIKSRDVLIDKDQDTAVQVLDEYSKKRSNEAYNFIFKNLIHGLRNSCTVTDEEYNDIKAQLDSLREDEFNFNYLKKAREIEENFYQKNFEVKK